MLPPQPPPVRLRLEPPFYAVPVHRAGTTEGLTVLPYDQFMDDALAEAVNAALRSTIEGRFEPSELHR